MTWLRGAVICSQKKRSRYLRRAAIFFVKRLTSDASGNSLLSPTWPNVRIVVGVFYRRLSLEFAPLRADIFSRD